MANMGRLERVALRDAWANEAADFTPWLAEEANIRLLGETIGLELEVDSTEKEVGPFAADILCRDTATDAWVLIENQLEKTDHTHLGQLMTYSAGLDAVTIIWIARQFTEEHRAALDWLNRVTDEDINFFGLEIELWRIGDSPMAPKFNVVCQPNEWVRNVKGTTSGRELSEFRRIQLDFWTGFKAYMDERSHVKCGKPGPQHWIVVPAGRTGFRVQGVFSTWDSDEDKNQGVIRAEFVTDHEEYAKAFYAYLESRKEIVEREAGEALHWYNPNNARVCRIYVRKPVDIMARESWPQYFEWLRIKIETLYGVFQPLVKETNFGELLSTQESARQQ